MPINPPVVKKPKKKEYSDPYMDPNHPMNRESTGPSTLGSRIEKDSKTRKPIIKKSKGGKVGQSGHNRLY